MYALFLRAGRGAGAEAGGRGAGREEQLFIESNIAFNLFQSNIAMKEVDAGHYRATTLLICEVDDGHHLRM